MPMRFMCLPVVFLLLTGCAGARFDEGHSETVLPLNRAWVDGQQVEYITTDISDLTMAKALGVNYVPRLAEAVPTPGQRSVLERVYKFAHNEQISIFQSAPSPTGGDNKEKNYSPLWRMVMVQWRKPEYKRELTSEEALLAAEEKGEISLSITRIVVNCPITRSVDRLPLQGVR